MHPPQIPLTPPFPPILGPMRVAVSDARRPSDAPLTRNRFRRDESWRRTRRGATRKDDFGGLAMKKSINAFPPPARRRVSWCTPRGPPTPHAKPTRDARRCARCVVICKRKSIRRRRPLKGDAAPRCRSQSVFEADFIGVHLLPGKMKPRRTGPLIFEKGPFSLISGIEEANSRVFNLPGDFLWGLHFPRAEGGSWEILSG